MLRIIAEHLEETLSVKNGTGPGEPGEMLQRMTSQLFEIQKYGNKQLIGRTLHK